MKYLSILLVFFLSGCTYSKVSSYADRSILPTSGFQHVIVSASNFPLGERQTVESMIVQSFYEIGVLATKGTDIIPPTGNLTSKEIDQRIANSGADSILLLFETDRGSTETYVPPQILTSGVSSTIGSVQGFGGMYSINTTTTYSPPTITGGYSVTKPNASYGASLFDLKEGGRRVWIAEIDTAGSAFSSYEDLATEAGQAIFQRMSKDGITFNSR